MRRLLPVLALAAFPAAGQDAGSALSAAEFEAYVLGKTLYFSSSGTAYGAEEYRSGRRVVWTFLDGECIDGHWYEEDGLICFVYEAEILPQCWSFWRRPGGLAARFENDPGSTELYEVDQSSEPLRCPGPDVGA